MLRTIRKGLYKSNNVRFLALLIAVAFVLLTEIDRKSTRLNSSHSRKPRMPSSA